MTTKLTREQLKELTAEQKIEYQQARNRERVAKYRANNKEKADEYNRKYKKHSLKKTYTNYLKIKGILCFSCE